MTGSSDADSTGPIDRQTLRLLERHLAADARVATTEFDPDATEPRLLRAHLETSPSDEPARTDTTVYPSWVDAARLDVRWFTTGDFSVHYVERDGETTWECRWDRHPNAHNSRLHFHRPPNGDAVEDLSLPSTHPLEVYGVVLGALAQRLEQ